MIVLQSAQNAPGPGTPRPSGRSVRGRVFASAVAALVALAASGATAAAHAAGPSAEPQERSNPQDPNSDDPEKGWWFFKGPKKQAEPEAPAAASAPAATTGPAQNAEKRCKTKETWSPACGFVNPGADFEFQAKQRDALMERMVVSQNDPKAVEAFQYYMRWALERTAEVSNLWYYNMVQNPELDPTVKQPVSAFGLRLMADINRGEEAKVGRLLKEEGAALIYFTRSDCQFCHSMAGLVKGLAADLSVPVLNASLDGKCIPGMEQGCGTQEVSTGPAQLLQVTVVPTVFLYVPKQTWLRVSTGVTDQQTMRTRVIQFFTAYRTALLNGVNNGEGTKAAVDFSGNTPGGATEGIQADGSKPQLPSESDIAALLGAPSRK